VLWLPPGDGPHPALIVLGGSGGGYSHRYAQQLVNRGYAALSLAYFGVEDLPEHLVGIPLEYFSEGLDWLAGRPEIDGTRLGVTGVSRGGELSLLLGSIEPRLKAVVAWAPSHVTWAGCCGLEQSSQASWTYQGKPLPFAGPSVVADERWSYWPRPFDDDEITILDYFWLGLANEAVANQAVIEVEKSQGAIMMITGGKDETWPASYMGDQVMKRLTAHEFEHPFVHVQFDNAGHILGAFPDTPVSRFHAFPVEGAPFLYRFGGDPVAMVHESQESWRLVERFLEENL
jgi:acetyl esterase/lipase